MISIFTTLKLPEGGVVKPRNPSEFKISLTTINFEINGFSEHLPMKHCKRSFSSQTFAFKTVFLDLILTNNNTHINILIHPLSVVFP